MYWIPILIIAVVCVVGVAWSPIFAVILAIPALLAFFLFVGMSARADETEPGVPGQEGSKGRSTGGDTRTDGIWGEKRA